MAFKHSIYSSYSIDLHKNKSQQSQKFEEIKERQKKNKSPAAVAQQQWQNVGQIFPPK